MCFRCERVNLSEVGADVSGMMVTEVETSDWKIAGSVPALSAHVLKRPWALNLTLLLMVMGRYQYKAAEPPSVCER